MTSRVDTPQTRCRAAFARADITPPVGIYHRMWGAALHDRATGVHRPLTATALWLEALDGKGHQLVMGLDHCLLDGAEFARLREQVGRAAEIPVDDVMVSMSHTHGSAWMSRSRSRLPGGDLIGPYLDGMTETCAKLARQARDAARSATLLYGTARCALAAHRDFWDAKSKQFVCGFNPDGPADDTVLVAKGIAEGGEVIGTIVNYACHPTTLAWENTFISPDYVGAMREVVERETAAPCLFLQGSSGDLGPREGYVGDVSVADRNGRQLGFAALSGLEALPAAGDLLRVRRAGGIRCDSRDVEARAARQCRLRPQRILAIPALHGPPSVTVRNCRRKRPREAELAKWEAEENDGAGGE